MSTTANDQTSIYEKTIEDPDLEAHLEKRATAKEAASKANAKVKEIDDVVKFKLGELELGIDAAVRIGRFVVTKKPTKAKSVSFETAPGERLQISILDDE